MFRAAVLLRSVAFLVSFAVADASRWKGIEFTKVFGCNFDTSMCGFVQDINDDFNWTRHMGDTSSSSTGPSADHTTGNGSYMYIETSSPRQQGDKAILNSPQLQFSGSMCLKFYYHMYGSSIGTLNVLINGNNVFTASGDKGNKWLSVAINLNLSGKQAVTFEGIRGSSYHGDIAVDDFELELGSCYSIFGCNFDTSMCGFVQDNNDDFNWTRHMGDTSSSSTGPSADHTTGNGYYMYVETSSPRQQGDIAKLKSPWLPFLGSMCLKFYYHMYGSGIGTLKVNSSGMHTYLFTASGDKGNKWLMATIDVNFTGIYTVTFEGMRGTDFQGDIAIDDFVLEPGSCFSNSGLDCSPTEIINLSATLLSRMVYRGHVGMDGGLLRRGLDKRSIMYRPRYWIYRHCDLDGNRLMEMGEFVWCLNHWSFRVLSGFLELDTNCLSGFIKSCDNDGNLEISEQEWPACFEIEEGKWSRWSPWTDCSRTCRKGGQSRSRTCSGKVTGKALNSGRCAGKPQQGKSCADWKCPDGKKSCPAYKKGTLEGRVFSFGDAPLAGANVSLAESPYVILSRSQENGFFVVDVFCFEKEKPILITRHGYVPQIVEVPDSRSVLKVKMDNAVHPTVKIHPEDRRRFVGQDVTLCCQVEGNPPPVIEWFRNGNILDQDKLNYNESLMLRKVGKNMAGEFRCRAVNEFGAEFSEPAVLEVLDPVGDTCNSALSDHFVTLPDGCSEVSTGNKKINIGKCKTQPCLRADTLLPESCDEAERCCQAGTVSETTVRCGQEEFTMERVLNCICDVCNDKATIVGGIVVGGPHQRPVEYCDILVNDTVVSYSDYDGTFKIPVPNSAQRLVATFRDYMEEYEESTVVLFFQKGTATFHKIHLRPEAAPIEFDAEEGKEVPIANDDVAQVIIPPNSLIDKDGNPKKGKAKVKIQFNDPRNVRDILESPGDFSTIDEDGEEQLLRTYGVFEIKVQDENNQNLALTKNLHININLEQLTGEKFEESEPFPHLWWLDEKTGRWVDAGELKLNEKLTQRPKRQAWRNILSGDIPNFIRRINIDRPERMCFAKVRVEANGGGIETAKVTAVFKTPGEEFTQGYQYGYTDSDGYACIMTLCNSECYLAVEKDRLRLLPQNDNPPSETEYSTVDVDSNGKVAIKFNADAQTNNGPVYQRDERRFCMENSADQRVFSFHGKDKYQEAFKVEYKLIGTSKDKYKRKARIDRCFLRVVTSGTKGIAMKAESYSDKDGKVGYGIKSTERVKDNQNLFAACLEHPCAERGDAILVHFTAINGKCRRSHVPEPLDSGKNQGLKENEAKVLIPHHRKLSGASLGIWIWKRMKSTVKQVEDECVKSKNSHLPHLEGFAVKFKCD